MVCCVLYLQKIFHDANLLVWPHCGYQALCKEVYHAVLAHHEAILLMLTIYKNNNKNNGIHTESRLLIYDQFITRTLRVSL